MFKKNNIYGCNSKAISKLFPTNNSKTKEFIQTIPITIPSRRNTPESYTEIIDLSDLSISLNLFDKLHSSLIETNRKRNSIDSNKRTSIISSHRFSLDSLTTNNTDDEDINKRIMFK